MFKPLLGALRDGFDIAERIARGMVSRDELAYQLLPQFTLEVIRRYHRIETTGIEHIPKQGPVIIVSNHSGYAGFDAVMLAHEVRRLAGRSARLVAHKLWFMGQPVSVVSSRMGLIPADTNSCLELLQRNKALILFPEGEAGNFKPSHRRYRLQEFKRGFVRMAMISGAKIVPAYVIGAEETHINLSQIKFSKYVLGTVLPVPANVIPLPVKWTIRFLPPIELGDVTPADAMNREKVFFHSREVKKLLQKAIIDELRKRKPKTR
jgi:1-acyl-sn-glycerol-3-phosphate acyltransferase